LSSSRGEFSKFGIKHEVLQMVFLLLLWAFWLATLFFKVDEDIEEVGVGGVAAE